MRNCNNCIALIYFFCSYTKPEEQKSINERQSAVLNLRFEKKFSFAAIASELNISQKEVHDEFMAGYKLMQYQQKAL